MRVALAATLCASALLVPGASDAAGAVLPLVEAPDAAFVDVRMALSVSTTGSTRWSEITVPANEQAMWLVPVRPGAAIDWTPAWWLDALDHATAPHVVGPAHAPTCATRSAPEVPPPWTAPRPKQPPAALAIHETTNSARAYATERGYRLTPRIASRMSELVANGWSLVALEVAASSAAQSTSTLRVTDDGGAILPLVLTGQSSTRLTVFAIGDGVASVTGVKDVDGSALRWGLEGSTYAAWRKDLIEAGRGETWLRESAAHEALVDGTSLADDASNDLALALGDLAPASAVITRLVGWIPAGALGRNLAVGFDPAADRRSLVLRAETYEACPSSPQGGAPRRTPWRPPPPPPPDEDSSSSGCSSGGAIGTSGSRTTYEGSSSSESCSGDGSSGWDTSDDSDGWDDSDSCSRGSSNDDDDDDDDDHDDGWDSEDSDDGWDSEDMSPKNGEHRPAPKKPAKPHARTTKKAPSPVSRLALLVAALLLPLRRRRRGPEGL